VPKTDVFRLGYIAVIKAVELIVARLLGKAAPP
jgi:hypothetical protein